MSLTSLVNKPILRVFDKLRCYQHTAALPQQFRRLHSPHMALESAYSRIRLCESEDVRAGFGKSLSILREPRLGTYVRHLELDPTLFDGHWGGEVRRSYACSILQSGLSAKLEQAIVRAGFTEAKEKALVRNSLFDNPDPVD
ncbi:hypothetical protein BDV12DRAFT_88110 [Aspergillus spectabilis]